MKINRTTSSFLVFFLVLAAFPLFAQSPLKIDKLSDNLYQILGGSGANGGFFIGDNAVLVIDTKQTEESVNETLKAIRGITDKPIKFLVNTHSDGDHVSGNRFFPVSVTILAHENCRAEFFHPRSNGEPSAWTNPEWTPFLPSVTYKNKMDIYLGEKKVELWYFGVGHTTGDTVVYFPEDKTAFIGDQIFVGRPQLIHSYKGGNSFSHVETLNRMLETLDAERFCSGHADPVDREGIKVHIREIKALQDKVKDLVDQGKSLEETQAEFDSNLARLVESIVSELETK